MRELKYPKFNNFIGPKFSPLIMALITEKQLFYRDGNNDELKFISKKDYNGFFYLIDISDKAGHINIERTDSRYLDEKNGHWVEPSPLMSTQLLTDKEASILLSKLKAAGFEDEESTYPSVLIIHDTAGLKQFFNDMECADIVDNFYLLENDISVYDSVIMNDLNFLFSVFKHTEFKKKMALGDDSHHYNKYIIDKKEVVTFTNTSAGVDSFFIFEKNPITGSIKCWFEYLCDVNSVFKFNTIVVGRYKNIIEYYLNNKEPCFEYIDGKVVKNTKTHVIHYLYFINDFLATKLNVDVPYIFDNSDFNEVISRIQLPNLNWLYSALLWNGRDVWKTGKNGAYLQISKDSFEIKPNKQSLTLSDKDYGYISIFDKKSNILNVPSDIADDWKSFVIDGYWYVINNRDKMKVCQISDKDIENVTNHLKNIKLI